MGLQVVSVQVDRLKFGEHLGRNWWMGSSRIHVVVFMRKVNPQFSMVKQVDHLPQ